MRPDAIYTPPDIAQALVDTAGSTAATILDPACGDGNLLVAARKQWPNAHLIGNDTDEAAIGRLVDKLADCAVAGIDFLDDSEREESPLLTSLLGEADLILLNPPFSNTGQAHSSLRIGETPVRASRPLAFAITALPYLSTSGELIAILPLGSLSSDLNELAWTRLRAAWDVSEVTRFPAGSFRSVRAKTALVRIGQRIPNSSGNPADVPPTRYTPNGYRRLSVKLVRGVVQMHAVNGESSHGMTPVIHSTELQGGEVAPGDAYTERISRAIEGPTVLLARVGQPTPKKVSLYLSPQSAVPSDCVIALTCVTERDARELQSRIRSEWGRFENAHRGSCAPYITVVEVSAILSSINVDASM